MHIPRYFKIQFNYELKYMQLKYYSKRSYMLTFLNITFVNLFLDHDKYMNLVTNMLNLVNGVLLWN